MATRRDFDLQQQSQHAALLARIISVNGQVQDECREWNDAIERHQRRQTLAACILMIAAMAFLLWPVAILFGQLTVSSTTGNRPYKTLADLPRGAWFRDAATDAISSSMGADYNTRFWSAVIGVNHADGTVVFTDKRVRTPAQLSQGWVFTRDPFVPVPIEYPCLLGAESGDEL